MEREWEMEDGRCGGGQPGISSERFLQASAGLAFQGGVEIRPLPCIARKLD